MGFTSGFKGLNKCVRLVIKLNEGSGCRIVELFNPARFDFKTIDTLTHIWKSVFLNMAALRKFEMPVDDCKVERTCEQGMTLQRKENEATTGRTIDV